MQRINAKKLLRLKNLLFEPKRKYTLLHGQHQQKVLQSILPVKQYFASGFFARREGGFAQGIIHPKATIPGGGSIGLKVVDVGLNGGLIGHAGVENQRDG